MRFGCAVVVLSLSGVLGLIECTSSQNLHNFLKHPHYADGHQHSSQYSTKRNYDGKPFHSTGSASRLRDSNLDVEEEEEGPPSAPWNRVAPKDHYKMNGYQLKSTSATKSALLDDHHPAALPQELLEVREANEHFVRMRSNARCSIPRQQVVCVRDIYPDKEFLPKCTLLHRCSETSGCCEEVATRCSPKAMQEVVLHFYVLGGDHRSSDVEKLLFVNHTECECQPLPTDVPVTVTEDDGPDQNAVDHYPQGDQKYPKCRTCPSPFCIRELEDGRCSCDCFDRHKPCIRIKRGREPLTDAERRCVLAGHCNVPDCDYGSYDPENGRCPRKPDHEGFKTGEHGRRPHPNSRNPNHRWTYFERD